MIKLFTKSYYYIKRSSIVKKISFDNRTFYAKFERIDEPLSDLVIKQHLNRHFIIATPLLENNHTNYLIVEYKGSQSTRFYHLSKHLLKSFEIDNYSYYKGRKENSLQLIIKVDSLLLDEADEILEKISDALSMRMPKEWKCLPDKRLPFEYNIFTLPYGIFE